MDKVKLWFLVSVISLLAARNAYAHRLDEYLQSTIFSIDKDLVQGHMRLTPGVEVLPSVLAKIDTNSDGILSEAEQVCYAKKVLTDLSITVNRHHLSLHLISAVFPEMDMMRQGLGVIEIDFDARMPDCGSKRRLIFENHHERRLGEYLANCLTPKDPNIHIIAQRRNHTQSLYQIDYVLKHSV